MSDSVASPGCDLTFEMWEAAKHELELPRPFVHPYDIAVGVDWAAVHVVHVFRAPKKRRKRRKRDKR